MIEEKFQDAAALEAWLKRKGVDEDDVAQAAETLFTVKEGKGVKKSTQLLNISSDQLERLGVSILLSVELSNKLKEPQPNGKLRCCFVFNLLFEYGNDPLFLYSK
jgi:hypothetical protein